eukprot:3359571-Prymnesium_polylepis.1
MAAAWLALEDVHPTAGPLHVYTGSHKLAGATRLWDAAELGLESCWVNGSATGFARRDAEYTVDYPEYQDELSAMIARRGLAKRRMLLRRGETILWAASLLHGGEPVADRNRTRLSQASHYFLVPAAAKERQAYWIPSISRVSRKEIQAKWHLGSVFRRDQSKAFRRPGPYWLPRGFAHVHMREIDTGRLFTRNRTTFDALQPSQKRFCRVRHPRLGTLVRCEL